MASKGQKFNRYDPEFREMILKEYFEDHNGGAKYLAKKYGISYHTIETWIKKRKKPELFHEGGKRGRPRDSEVDWKERYEILKKFQAFLKAQRERK
jgi:transposase-like protein